MYKIYEPLSELILSLTVAKKKLCIFVMFFLSSDALTLLFNIHNIVYLHSLMKLTNPFCRRTIAAVGGKLISLNLNTRVYRYIYDLFGLLIDHERYLFLLYSFGRQNKLNVIAAGYLLTSSIMIHNVHFSYFKESLCRRVGDKYMASNS